jgi:hypothetical protein
LLVLAVRTGHDAVRNVIDCRIADFGAYRLGLAAVSLPCGILEHFVRKAEYVPELVDYHSIRRDRVHGPKLNV